MHLVDCWNTCFIWYWFSILNRNKRRFHAFYTVHLLCLRNFILQNASLMGHLLIQFFFANITLHVAHFINKSIQFNVFNVFYHIYLYTCVYSSEISVYLQNWHSHCFQESKTHAHIYLFSVSILFILTVKKNVYFDFSTIKFTIFFWNLCN